MAGAPSKEPVALAVGLSALCFAALGLLLLFAPEEVARAILPGPEDRPDKPLVQLLGTALLGFGAANWVARRSVLGGIYGRAIVAGNQTHLTMGALALLARGVATGGTPAYWVLTGFYVLAAALFLYLFFSTGLRRNQDSTT